MKIKLFFALFLGFTINLSAQGYLDGIEYYEADQFAYARNILERTLNDDVTDVATSSYYLGQIAIIAKEYDKALEYFNKGIEANPSYAYNYIGLAALELKNGNKKEAENYIKNAKKLSKKDAKLYVEIARMYYDIDSDIYKKEIQKSMKDAKKTNSKEPAYYIFIGDTIRNISTNENGLIGQAASNYETAIYYNPNSAVAYVKFSELYKLANTEFSIQKMAEFLKINPNSALAQREYADRLYDADRWREAFGAYETYLKNPSHFVEDEERFAILLMARKNYAEAYNIAKGVIGRVDNPNQMYRIMMHCKKTLNDYTEAAKCAEELLKSNGTVAVDHFTYGEILEELAKVDTINSNKYIENAIAQYKEALKLDDEKKYAVANKNIAYIYRNQNDFKTASEFFDIYMNNIEPKANDYYLYSGILYNYGRKLLSSNEVEAQSILQKAIEMADESVTRSDNPYAQERKAYILYTKNGNKITAEVIEAFEKVIYLLDLNPDYKTDKETYTSSLETIGNYYYNNGNNEKALNAYNRYLEFNPDNEKIKSLVKTLNK